MSKESRAGLGHVCTLAYALAIMLRSEVVVVRAEAWASTKALV